MLLLALNEAFDKRSIDLLLVIDQLGFVEWITGDGIIHYAPLTASNLVEVESTWHASGTAIGPQHMKKLYQARLTEAGKQFDWRQFFSRLATIRSPVSVAVAEPCFGRGGDN